MDFISDGHILSIGEGVLKACQQVSAVKDNIYEHKERVTVFISSAEEDIKIVNSPKTITIIDADKGRQLATE